MVNRRSFLFSTVVTFSTGLAGCSSNEAGDEDIQDSDGDGVIDSKDYAPQDPDVQEKSDLTSESTTQSTTGTPPQTEISTPTPTPTATATATPTPTATATATPTPTPSPETEQEALQAYQAGDYDFESVSNLGSSASNHFNSGRYNEAQEDFQETLETSQDAVAHFDEAETLAGQAGHEEAKEIAKEASKHLTEYWIPWAEEGIAASEAAQDGRTDEAEKHSEEAQRLTNESEYAETVIAEPDEFRDALGL